MSSSSTEATTSPVARRPHTADLGGPLRWKSTPLDVPPSQTRITNAYARKASASTAEKESTPPPNALRRNLDPESMPLRKPPPSREKRKLRRPQGTYGGNTTKTFSFHPGSLCRNPGCSGEHRPASGTTQPRAQ